MVSLPISRQNLTHSTPLQGGVLLVTLLPVGQLKLIRGTASWGLIRAVWQG
jgi:hypothetical protein